MRGLVVLIALLLCCSPTEPAKERDKCIVGDTTIGRWECNKYCCVWICDPDSIWEGDCWPEQHSP